MNEVIGTLILVDATKIIKDFGITSTKEANERVPVIDLKTPDSGKNYILMITQKKFVDSGMGTPYLSILATPGDEIRWWAENTISHSNFDINIKSITTDEQYMHHWKDLFENFPEEFPEKQECNLMVPPYLSNRDNFWSAQYIISKYRVKSKNEIFLKKNTICIPYKIELQIIMNQNRWYKKNPLCTLILHPSIILKSSLSEYSDRSEAAENHVTARLVDGNLFISN